MLESKNINFDIIKKEILKLLGHISIYSEYKSINNRKKSKERLLIKTPTLDEFSRDLTVMASQNLLDPIVGRKEEINRLIQILSRKKKNNPILISHPGVGKTAIVEGLVQNIISGCVPDLLLDKKILSLDLASVVAGTKYRGEFEERLKNIIQEIQNSKNIILFIDELHTLIGAGGAEGAIDAANILKPPLSQGYIQCIGATTLNEYKKYIEKDSALERRFQPILLEEPDVEETTNILLGLKKTYEKYHKVVYNKDSIEAASYAAHRYINDRYLPDKAIDLIDEVGARAKLKSTTRPKNFRNIKTKIKELVLQKDLFVKNQDYEKAAKVRDELAKLREELKNLSNNWQDALNKDIPHISKKDVYNVVSSITGIPLNKMQDTEESKKLLNLEKELSKKVMGQEQAISVISNCIRRSQVQLNQRNKPLGSFLFLGPTGVGKSYLAKCLSSIVFNSKNLIQVDMSEFMERFSISQIIGAPPGYIGYTEGGSLTQKIKRRPYSVVLIDEIEKAHPDVLNIFLQILEEGRLTDSLSYSVSFKNTIIIMTSNIGSQEIFKNSLGFNDTVSKNSIKTNFNNLRSKFLFELNKTLKPELINRIDDVIIFHPLEKIHIQKILVLLLKNLKEELEEKNIYISIDKSVENLILEKSLTKNFGARPIKKQIQNYIENPLSKELLKLRLLEINSELEKIEITFTLRKNEIYLKHTKNISKKFKINK